MHLPSANDLEIFLELLLGPGGKREWDVAGTLFTREWDSAFHANVTFVTGCSDHPLVVYQVAKMVLTPLHLVEDTMTM